MTLLCCTALKDLQSLLASRLPKRPLYLKGASPVPGPTMIMGLEASSGSLKSGFLCTYTGILSPTWECTIDFSVNVCSP